MTAEIEKIGPQDTDPDLFLAMCRANLGEIESVVCSVIVNGLQYTYWTKMGSHNLSFHLYGIQADLLDDLRQRHGDSTSQ